MATERSAALEALEDLRQAATFGNFQFTREGVNKRAATIRAALPSPGGLDDERKRMVECAALVVENLEDVRDGKREGLIARKHDPLLYAISRAEQVRDYLRAAPPAPGGHAQQIIDRQANDPGLWFVPTTATEDYLQRALRELHAAVEGR